VSARSDIIAHARKLFDPIVRSSKDTRPFLANEDDDLPSREQPPDAMTDVIGGVGAGSAYVQPLEHLAVPTAWESEVLLVDRPTARGDEHSGNEADRGEYDSSSPVRLGHGFCAWD
jgi:hypothetical protein